MKKEEKRVKDSDLIELGRRVNSKRKGKERKKEKSIKDLGGKKRIYRSIVDQWENRKDIERRIRRGIESKRKGKVRGIRKEDRKDKGIREDSIKIIRVNYGKLERERNLEKKKEEKSKDKAYRVLGLKRKTLGEDLERVKKRMEKIKGRGRERIGRIKGTQLSKERIWMNQSNKGREKMRKVISMKEREGTKLDKENTWSRGVGRYQVRRRKTLSRVRVQSRYPRIIMEKKRNMEKG